MRSSEPGAARPGLAVLDWGVGGFGLVALLRARRPGAAVRYVSDAGFAPYGQVQRAQLGRRVEELAQALAADGATHLVVACNAASTVLPQVPGLAVTGVIEHGVRAALATGTATIGVVGGGRTVRSGAYRRPLAAAGCRVRQRVAQPLSASVERGELDGPEVRAEVARIVRPLRSSGALVLACTHYPALARHFRRELPQARLVDPAAATLEWMAGAWPLEELTEGRTEVMTTGDPIATRAAARRAFGVVLSEEPTTALRR